MRNSTALRAGVPAPFETLQPLIDYLALLETVTFDPTLKNLEAYIEADLAYTAVANTSLSVWGDSRVNTCILHDGLSIHVALAQIDDHDSDEFTRTFGEHLKVPGGNSPEKPWGNFVPAVPDVKARAHFGTDAALRNAARGIVNHLIGTVIDSGAFPEKLVSAACAMLDESLVRIVGHDPDQLAFARKRMGRELLNIWVSETQWRSSFHTGDHHEILRNVKKGWKVFEPPYGSVMIAKWAGRLNPRNFF